MMVGGENNPKGHSTNEMAGAVSVSTTEVLSMGVPEGIIQDIWDGHWGLVTLGHAVGKNNPRQDENGTVEKKPSCVHLTQRGRNV